MQQVTVTPGSGITLNTLQDLGPHTAADSHPTTLAIDDPAVLALGAPNGGAWSGTGNATILGALEAIALQSLSANPVNVLKLLTSASNNLNLWRVVAAATTNQKNLKNAAGNIAWIDLYTAAAYDVFLKFYDKATTPTPGTDTPIWTIPLKTGLRTRIEFNLGLYFPTGISYAITKLIADSDTTVLVAGDVTGAMAWV